MANGTYQYDNNNEELQEAVDIALSAGEVEGVLQSDGAGYISEKPVDSAPTATSLNLVTSGGVKSALNNLQTTLEDEIKEASLGVLIPSGSCAFADLPDNSEDYLNHVYQVTDAFTTTSDFIEGAGVSVAAGAYVAIIYYNGAYMYAVYYSGVGDMQQADYDPDGDVKDAGGIPDYLEDNMPFTVVDGKICCVYYK